jgi:glutamine amidotransferase
MIAIIDYGIGNLRSVHNAVSFISPQCKSIVTSDPEIVSKADRVIFPGQGAMPDCIIQLDKAGLKESVIEAAKQKPFLGICLGLQMLFDSSEEGDVNGFGLIPGKVKKFDKALLVNKPYLPHMGWNNINNIHDHIIFTGVNENQGFYFVHSYYYECENEQNILTVCNYGLDFSSSIFNENIFGMQFHPEKSHSNGENLLNNFAKLDIC